MNKRLKYCFSFQRFRNAFEPYRQFRDLGIFFKAFQREICTWYILEFFPGRFAETSGFALKQFTYQCLIQRGFK